MKVMSVSLLSSLCIKIGPMNLDRQGCCRVWRGAAYSGVLGLAGAWLLQHRWLAG